MVIRIRAHNLIHAVHRCLGKGIGRRSSAEKNHGCQRNHDSVSIEPTINHEARSHRNDGSVSTLDSSNRAFDIQVHSRSAFPVVRLDVDGSRIRFCNCARFRFGEPVSSYSREPLPSKCHAAPSNSCHRWRRRVPHECAMSAALRPHDRRITTHGAWLC